MYRLDNFNTKCNACSLSRGKAVPGQSEVPLSNVLLVVISAYPGVAEIATGLTLSLPIDDNPSKMNAGKFLRLSLNKLFKSDKSLPTEVRDIEKYTYFTNALKCSNQDKNNKITITPNHINKCREMWLSKELALLHPEVPILIAGGEACKSLLGIKESLYSNSNKILWYEKHPVVVTNNPIEWERGALKELKNEEEGVEEVRRLVNKYKNPNKNFLNVALKSVYWTPTPIGSAVWFARRDLERIKKLVLEFYRRNYE